MNKTTCLTFLVCVNLILLTGLIFFSTTPRAAYAQGIGLADNYMLVAGEIQDEFDALYLIDMRERTLHTFYFRKGTKDLEYGGYRLLEQDFRHNRS
ncbi:MAG: hypothetical protein KAY37_05990 [Phycisphaerae bacterium]|nr:hypothetical protein [Phycisphaerae bacterium]